MELLLLFGPEDHESLLLAVCVVTSEMRCLVVLLQSLVICIITVWVVAPADVAVLVLLLHVSGEFGGVEEVLLAESTLGMEYLQFVIHGVSVF